MTENPFTRKGKAKKHGQKAEKRTARRFGTTARAGSGAVEGFKGDFSLTDFLVENKATEHRSIGVKYAWCEKISKEALAENKDPAISIQFVDQTGLPIARDASWVLIPERVFAEFVKKNWTSDD